MKKNISAAVLIFAMVLISLLQINCATVPVYRLDANEKTEEWYYGRQVLTKQDELAALRLTYEDIADNSYIFYLEAENNTDSPTTLNPSDIYLESYHPVSGQDPIILNKINALDPENKILTLEKSINSENSSESTRRGLSCLVSTVDLVGSIAKTGKSHSREEIEKENRERERRRVEDQNAEYDYKERMKDLTSLKDYWKNEAFRKITISKSQKAEGYIHIPIPQSGVNIRIIIPFGKNEYEFNYKQVRIN